MPLWVSDRSSGSFIMQLIYHCPACQTLEITVANQEQTQLACSSCGWTRAFPPEHLDGEKPLHCLACGTHDLWRQKDFPQGLGLLLVATGALLSTYFWAKMMPGWAIGVLMGFAAIDLVLFAVMPDVLVCYRCSARHRKAQVDEQHPRFNLELNERYRQETIRLAEAEKSKPVS